MRVLVIGGYGFIGRAVGEALQRRGHEVVGWGRDAGLGRRLLPQADWIEGDLRHMGDAASWQSALRDVDAVVNASGALQGGDLPQVQGRAIMALIDACVAAGIMRFVQISAPGATADADTRFMSSKAVADDHLRASGLDWTILRPVLVIGRNAYGGTALVRALAAFPVQLTVYGDSLVQCVGLDDVATACADAVEGKGPGARDRLLAAAETLKLSQIVAMHRRWLGLHPAWAAFDLPPMLAAPMVWVADAAGWLGWRSPLRSTALRVMKHGVVADGAAATPSVQSLADILAAHPAGLQDRISARLFLLQPVILLALAALWIGSGVVGLIETDRAAALLGGSRATLLVRACSLLDLLLGGALLVRAWARPAAMMMAAVSAVYLLAGTILTPGLWLDPLAPLLKILPAFALTLVAAAILDRR